jgi:phage-related protein
VENQILTFSGRPDGLGNRIEEIMHLEAFCYREGGRCRYIWTNEHRSRTYQNLLKTDRVEIVGSDNGGGH